MDRFDSMRLLLKVVETGSLSGASRALDIPLATLSRHLNELEARLGAQLLARSSRRTSLTDAGHAYVSAIRDILERLQDAEEAAAGATREPRGTLSLTAPIVMGRTYLAAILADFLHVHPHIDVRLHLGDQILALSEKQIDVALRVGVLPDSGLVATEVGTVRRITCASPAYLASRGTPATPNDLAGHDCVTFDNLASAEVWRFRDGGTVCSVGVRSRMVVTTAEAALAAAEAGLGLTRLLSYQVTHALASGRMAVVLKEYEPAPWPVHLVYSGQQAPPRKLGAFLAFAAPRLRAQLAEDAERFRMIASSTEQVPKECTPPG
jgi:DNA-binding transcriptional LysR family regulator